MDADAAPHRAGGPHGPALRLLAARGRVVTSRRRILAAAAAARRGGRAYTLWPDAGAPMIAADVAYPPAAEWLRATMVPTLRRLPDAAGWMALRAGAVLVPREPGLALEVAARVAPAGGPVLRVAMYSPSGQAVSKVVCFVFGEGEHEPRLVVKAIADPRFGWRLHDESAALEGVRARVAHDAAVAAALPPAPSFARQVRGDVVVAEPFDPLGTATGSGVRGPAMGWLRAFQAASATGARPWSDDEQAEVLRGVREAWGLAGLGTGDRVAARVAGLVEALRGVEVPRCAVHGDFWRENVAAVGGRVRVYDWEWARLDGTALVDLWTYELAELRILARAGRPALEEPLAEALYRVAAELRARGVDDRLAAATLAPVLGALSFRVRTHLRTGDEMERHSIALMRAAQQVLERS